jgi:peroxiredoxin
MTLPRALAIAWLAAALAACNEPIARKNEPAPELAVVDAQDRMVRLADLRGQVVVVNFWLSGCGPCLAEMPELDSVYRRHRAKGLEILAVNFGQRKNAIQETGRRTRVTYPLLADPLKIAMRRYGVFGAPTSFIIDARGVLRERIDGPLSADALEARLAHLL